MFEQLKEFGAAYIVFMVLVVVVFFMDTFVIINVLTKRKKELTDYAEFMIKFTKIIMLAAIGAYFILQTLDNQLLYGVKVLHIVIGIMALLDAAASLFVKLKFRYDRVHGVAIKPEEKDLM